MPRLASSLRGSSVICVLHPLTVKLCVHYPPGHVMPATGRVARHREFAALLHCGRNTQRVRRWRVLRLTAHRRPLYYVSSEVTVDRRSLRQVPLSRVRQNQVRCPAGPVLGGACGVWWSHRDHLAARGDARRPSRWGDGSTVAHRSRPRLPSQQRTCCQGAPASSAESQRFRSPDRCPADQDRKRRWQPPNQRSQRKERETREEDALGLE